jgi:hypothetical protein
VAFPGYTEHMVFLCVLLLALVAVFLRTFRASRYEASR